MEMCEGTTYGATMYKGLDSWWKIISFVSAYNRKQQQKWNDTFLLPGYGEHHVYMIQD